MKILGPIGTSISHAIRTILSDAPTYDQKCHDLAESFLQDVDKTKWNEQTVNDLAQDIQAVIEDFIRNIED